MVRQIKSAPLSIGENGENERTIHNRRRPSVLDEKALREADTQTVREQRINAITRSYEGILQSIGEDPSRQGRIFFPHQIIFLLYLIFFWNRSSQDT